MLVDFHTHVLPAQFRTERARMVLADRTFAEMFSDPRARVVPVEELLGEMDLSGVDVSVVLGYGWTDFGVAQMANDYALESARAYPSRVIAFCSVNPAWGPPAVKEVERCAEGGARGIGELHPDTQQFDPGDGTLLAPMMEAARSLDLIVTVHASEPVGHTYAGKGTATPGRLLQMVESFPGNRFVLAHWGGGLPFYALMPEVSAAMRNVWFDCSAGPLLYRPGVVGVAAEAAGAERLLFGSDYPLVTQRRALRDTRAGGLRPADQAAMLGGNAADLLRL